MQVGIVAGVEQHLLRADLIDGLENLARLRRKVERLNREAYVLAYIDSFWVIAWVLAASLLFIFLLRPPPPNPLTPPSRAA